MNKRPYRRKQYWNRREMTLWERAYLPEILRGLAITGGVLIRNMWRWITGRKGALTTYYPEEKRADYGRFNRGKHARHSVQTASRSASRATCARPSARRK